LRGCFLRQPYVVPGGAGDASLRRVRPQRRLTCFSRQIFHFLVSIFKVSPWAVVPLGMVWVLGGSGAPKPPSDEATLRNPRASVSSLTDGLALLPPTLKVAIESFLASYAYWQLAEVFHEFGSAVDPPVFQSPSPVTVRANCGPCPCFHRPSVLALTTTFSAPREHSKS
jgi:hypothetical protein